MYIYNIFYSWQSDIKQNDLFVQECLENAIHNIKSLDTKFKIDRDTLNKKGTPDIPNTVFNKIADEIDIFISDITIINKQHQLIVNNLRLTPNPNVLLELGFAASAILWDNIICVMNIAYGIPDELPFDLRYRKPLQFNLPEDCDNKTVKSEMEKLTEEFEKTIRSLNPNEKKYRLRETAKVLVSNEWQSIGKSSNDIEDWGNLTITHEINNIFKFLFVSKSEPIYGDWTGQLYLNKDFYFSGKINFELNSRNSYGFKEFFIDERENYYYLFLFPINLNQGDHGREVFKRKKY